jgi:hypothetical protein
MPNNPKSRLSPDDLLNLDRPARAPAPDPDPRFVSGAPSLPTGPRIELNKSVLDVAVPPRPPPSWAEVLPSSPELRPAGSSGKSGEPPVKLQRR